MRAPILFTIAICTLVSCGEEVKKVVVTQKGNDALIIGDPLDCGLDSLLVFPVGSSYTPEVFEGELAPEPENLSESERTYSENKVIVLADNNASSNISFSVNSGTTSTLYDSGASMEYVNENSEDFDIRNLLFYDMMNNTSYPLMLDSMHILSFAIHREFEKDMIFYRVVKTDNNKDKKFNSLDPIMLYISDLDGRNFTQITPENEHFIDYTFYPKTASILIKTVIDSNDDKDFASNDETNFRSMSITKPSMGKEIFSTSLKDSLRVYNK